MLSERCCDVCWFYPSQRYSMQFSNIFCFALLGCSTLHAECWSNSFSLMKKHSKSFWRQSANQSHPWLSGTTAVRKRGFSSYHSKLLSSLFSVCGVNGGLKFQAGSFRSPWSAAESSFSKRTWARAHLTFHPLKTQYLKKIWPETAFFAKKNRPSTWCSAATCVSFECAAFNYALLGARKLQVKAEKSLGFALPKTEQYADLKLQESQQINVQTIFVVCAHRITTFSHLVSYTCFSAVSRREVFQFRAAHLSVPANATASFFILPKCTASLLKAPYLSSQPCGSLRIF